MLLKIKVIELINHIEYIQQTCQSLISDSHPNLKDRLHKLLTEAFSNYKTEAEKLAHYIDKYEKSSAKGFDTWQQLYSELADLASTAQYFRTKEIPAYLASSPDDFYVSNLLQAIHTEIGLSNIKPVASLYQSTWFAIARPVPTHPLYFLPSSVVADPSELPLIFHEIAHVLFAMGKDFSQLGDTILKKTIQRKVLEIDSEPDPKMRQNLQEIMSQQRDQMRREQEELVCDIVGTLLGGNAFVISLAVGLFCLTLHNPFDHYLRSYPPIDYRMRVGQRVFKLMGFKTDMIDYVASNWSNVKLMHLPQTWYTLLYDDQYIDDLTIAIKDYLTAKGIILYSDNCGGIRQQLNDGLIAMVNAPKEHNKWIESQAKRFYETYSSSKSSSSNSHSSS